MSWGQNGVPGLCNGRDRAPAPARAAPAVPSCWHHPNCVPILLGVLMGGTVRAPWGLSDLQPPTSCPEHQTPGAAPEPPLAATTPALYPGSVPLLTWMLLSWQHQTSTQQKKSSSWPNCFHQATFLHPGFLHYLTEAQHDFLCSIHFGV